LATKGTDTLQWRYLEVSGVTGAWQEFHFNDQGESWPGGRPDISTP